MSTIPASQIVQVNPGVLSAGGSGLNLIGLVLSASYRVPVNTVQSFASAASVSTFFGSSSTEAALAAVYFQGLDNSLIKPGAMLFSQYNQGAVSAWLQSGNVASLGLPAIQAMSGSLTVIMDGYTHTAASLNLSGATSLSSAAALIQTGLQSAVVAASVTGSIAPGTASAFTGSITGNVLTVTAVTAGVLQNGTLCAGGTIAANTIITSQLSGTAGGVGVYAVSVSQVVASLAITGTYGILTVTAVSSGTISLGQILSGSGVTANTQVYGLGTGTGLVGTYFVSPSQTAVSTAITASAPLVLVTYDSVAGAFLVKSGITGAQSTSAFATGTLSASLLMTSATGAVLSQGSNANTPASFMNLITPLNSNWASFMLAFDPDYGAQNTQKLAFAAWTSTQNGAFGFIAWDTDITPTTSSSAPASLGALLTSSNYSGTIAFYEPNGITLGPLKSALILSFAPCLNFQQTNGRDTLAFSRQAGLIADVTNTTVYSNLLANGYSFYGAFATRSQTFVWVYNGGISGPFKWYDSYINQIWLNSAFQQAFMQLLQNTFSIPYNTQGKALIRAAAMDPINQAINFGAIRTGIILSAAQTAEVNAAAGGNVAPIIQNQGWYLQVGDATPQQRALRGSPPCQFFYSDGQSVQAITLSSVSIL